MKIRKAEDPDDLMTEYRWRMWHALEVHENARYPEDQRGPAWWAYEVVYSLTWGSIGLPRTEESYFDFALTTIRLHNATSPSG